MTMTKVEITVRINGVSITGELLEIVDILHKHFKVPSPAIYQFCGEVGIFAVENGISFDRPYCDEGKMVFRAAVIKR